MTMNLRGGRECERSRQPEACAFETGAEPHTDVLPEEELHNLWEEAKQESQKAPSHRRFCSRLGMVGQWLASGNPPVG
jgi:hypothetical protein